MTLMVMFSSNVFVLFSGPDLIRELRVIKDAHACKMPLIKDEFCHSLLGRLTT